MIWVIICFEYFNYIYKFTNIIMVFCGICKFVLWFVLFVGINLLNKETPKTFLEKINNSKIGINAFHVKQDYEFPIYPVYANIGNFRFSFEPFDKVNGQYRLKWTKEF